MGIYDPAHVLRLPGYAPRSRAPLNSPPTPAADDPLGYYSLLSTLPDLLSVNMYAVHTVAVVSTSNHPTGPVTCKTLRTTAAILERDSGSDGN